jgi:uncharacterized protein (DUF2252 family)
MSATPRTADGWAPRSRPGAAGPRTARPGAARPRLTPAERAALGKAARAATARRRHASFEPAADRPDPVSLLQQQATTRIGELVAIRYGRMLASPLAFFRGAALPMAADLAGTPSTGLVVQSCGDAHLSNFGVFASPERRLVFDINDFDETLPGPWEWDVKRLAASLEVAARGNDCSGRHRREIVVAAVAGYRRAMRRFAGMSDLDVWYAHAELDELHPEYRSILAAGQRGLAVSGRASARSRYNLQELGKLTHVVHGRPRIRSDPPLLVRLADLEEGQPGRAEFDAQLSDFLARYIRTLEPDRRFLLGQFEVADMARRVAGIGSVGMRCWIVLLFGRDQGDPLFLQVKEAQPSVLSAFAGASAYANEGQRVVRGQRLMQAASDIFLGWQRTGMGPAGQPSDFYVRQLRDWKFSIDVESMPPRSLRIYGELCGWSLARAHARSGDRIAIGAYLGGGDAFDRAIGEFAVAYADQNERDRQALQAAVAAGRVTARTGI